MPRMVSQNFSTRGEHAEKGPGLRPMQEPRGQGGTIRGRSDGSQTGLLQRDLLTWSPGRRDAASVHRGGRVLGGQDSGPSPHRPVARPRGTLGRNACLLRGAGGRDKMTRECPWPWGPSQADPQDAIRPGVERVPGRSPCMGETAMRGRRSGAPMPPGREYTPTTQRKPTAVAWVVVFFL